MQCPNCRHEESDSAPECSQCGFVLAKWRAQQGQGGAPARPAVPAKKSSGVDLSIWILLLVATVAVWRLTRSGAEEEAVPSAPAAAGAGAAEAGSPIPDGSWRFTGRVTDLLRESPVKGAGVAFLDWETGRRYETVTDEDGRYAVDVDIRWKLGYAAEVSHPAYRARYWTGTDLKADRASRLRLGLEPPPSEPDARAYRGTRRREPVEQDFALFPRDLSDAERAETSL